MTTLAAFYNNITNGTDKYYVFIGSPDADYMPVDIHDDAILLKKVSLSDIIKSVKRYDWEYGHTFYQYTLSEYNSGTLNGKNFYANVYTNGVYKIYKCINNANNSPSIISPGTINRNGIVTLDDGYSWIYMYSIPAKTFNKFANNTYMPFITDSEVIKFTMPGTVENIQLMNGGYGYTYCNVSIIGDGTGATGFAEIINSTVTKIILTSTGSGYTTATVALIGDGSGASAVAVLPPTGGHGSDTEAELFCNSLLFSVDISNKADYDVLPYGVSYRKYGLIQSITYENYTGDMSVDYVQIDNAGTGYHLENKPSVVFSGGFDGDQITAGTDIPATAYPSMNNDSITRVVLTNNGKNYRDIPTVSLSGGDGSGSALTAVMKSTPIRNFISLNVDTQSKQFRQYEVIKQGNTTAQVLFHDIDKKVIGIYNPNGSFVGDTIVEGLSSGASAITLSTGFLNTVDTSFNNSNVVASYTNSVVTRQKDQPEKINLALVF